MPDSPLQCADSVAYFFKSPVYHGFGTWSRNRFPGIVVGQFEYFFPAACQGGSFQFGQILAVHRDDAVKRRRIALADFAAGIA